MARNVLLLTVDSLRAIPNLTEEDRDLLTVIDRLERDGGVSLSRAYATGPTTRSSFPAILTGTYALSSDDYPYMGEKRPSLATSLSKQGIETAGFTSNPFLSRTFNYNIGFDEYRDYQNIIERKAAKLFPDGIENPRGILRTLNDIVPLTAGLKRGYRLISGDSRPYRPAAELIEDTLDFVDRCESRFFCWTHLMDVHQPCFPPESYRSRHGAGKVTLDEVSDIYSRFAANSAAVTPEDISLLDSLYRAALDYVNDQINRLLDELQEQGVLHETAVILTSDHGELYGEYDEYGKPPRLYDELVHVPLVVSDPPPALAEAPEQLFSLVDLPFVVHALTGTEPDSQYEGHPLTELPRQTVLSEEFRHDGVAVSVRSDSVRYEIDGIRGRTDAYSINADSTPAETVRPVAEIPGSLKQRAEGHLDSVAADTDDINVSNDIRDRLEHLGYLNE